MSNLNAAVMEDRPTRASAARLDGLDWLRAGAAVLVVALHAGIAYLVAPMPGLAWATHDPVGSPFVDGVTWWINGFIMPLFFVQSGFLAAQLMRQMGPHEFLQHRTRRLLGPLAFGCVLILPLDLYAWLLGWAADGRIALRKLQSLKIDSPLGDNLWGVSHLWFLESLWVFCVAAWAVTWVARWRKNAGEADDCKLQISNLKSAIPNLQFAISRSSTASMPRGVKGFIAAGLMTASTAALWWEPQVLIGFRHSWRPLPANLLFYGPWFVLGWIVQEWQFNTRGTLAEGNALRRSELIPSSQALPFTRLCECRILASLGLFAVLLPRIHQHVAAASSGLERVALVGVFVLHAWLIVTGLIGVSLRWLNRRPPRAVKYLAEASFWIYLFHHPVVGLTQISVSQTGWPVAIKFGVTLLSGLALSLLTYHVLVRRTWVGALLNGRRFGVERRPEAPQLLPLPTPGAAPLRKSA
ncbi:MAG: acyltransferase family protein [Planctomycetaceae bacterium]